MAAERLFIWQQRDRRGAARHLFLDGVGRAKSEAIDPVPMQARKVDLVVARDLRGRLAGGKPAVNLRPLQMLAGTTNSTHGTLTKITLTQSRDCIRRDPSVPEVTKR